MSYYYYPYNSPYAFTIDSLTDRQYYGNAISHSLPNRVTLRIPDIKESRKVLVLDLDETLVHCSPFPPHPDVQSYKFDDDECYIFLRPNVEEFLEKVTAMFEVYIFTAGTKEYADRIIDKLCPQIDVFHRHYRDSCKFVSNKCKKDLKIFKRDLKDIIMVDDNPHMREYYPKNTLFIQKWNGIPNDEWLLGKIFPILQDCESAEDIRPIITKAKLSN